MTIIAKDIYQKAIDDILWYLPQPLRGEISAIQEQLVGLEEIRLRCSRPIALRLADREFFLTERGDLSSDFHKGRLLSQGEMAQLLLLLSGSSFYAFEEELKRGYLTLPGGHRAGLCGKGVLENGSIRSLKEISSINLRLAHYIKGSAEKLLPILFMDQPFRLANTLLVSPPRGGKTTLLRDLACQLSDGNPIYGSYNVAIVDERSEIAAMLQGSPQLPIGCRSDILDGCPKAEGMMLMIRSMAPQILICDEIGCGEDAKALEEAMRAGIAVIASAHGSNKEELMGRPVLKNLIESQAFERIIILSRRLGPGTVEEIFDGSWQLIS